MELNSKYFKCECGNKIEQLEKISCYGKIVFVYFGTKKSLVKIGEVEFLNNVCNKCGKDIRNWEEIDIEGSKK